MPRILDISSPVSQDSPRSHDQPETIFESYRWYSRDGGRVRQIRASLHIGTHVDTNALYKSTGETVEKLSLDRLIGEALFVDCRLGEHGVISADYLEKQAANLKRDDILVLVTGWHRYYEDEETYELKAPGLDKSGVDWVVARHPKAVCADSPSSEHVFMRWRRWKNLRPDIVGKIDPDPTQFPPSYGHRTMLPQGILMVEKLGGQVEELVGKRAQVYMLPAKYVGVEAAPLRAIAILDE